MSTYDKRLDLVEKDIVTMKRDIIYKLDETNTAIAIVKGVMGTLAQDVKVIKSQLKTMDIRLEGIDTLLVRLGEQQNEQGQDIKDMKRRLDAMDGKFDKMLLLLTALTPKPNPDV